MKAIMAIIERKDFLTNTKGQANGPRLFLLTYVPIYFITDLWNCP